MKIWSPITYHTEGGKIEAIAGEGGLLVTKNDEASDLILNLV